MCVQKNFRLEKLFGFNEIASPKIFGLKKCLVGRIFPKQIILGLKFLLPKINFESENKFSVVGWWGGDATVVVVVVVVAVLLLFL